VKQSWLAKSNLTHSTLTTRRQKKNHTVWCGFKASPLGLLL
jgi:hypothetical protein